jgi:hypothetical protein
MSPVLYPPSRPQAIGEVLDSAFRIFQATLLKSLPYSVLATVAGQLQNIYAIVTGRTLHTFSNSDPGWWTLYLLGAILGCAFINAIIIRQAAVASGSQSVGPAAILEGLRKVPANILMVIVIAIVVGIWFLPLLGIPAAHRTWSIAVLCLPAAYLGVLFLCSWPALLVGHKGPLESLRYSAHLIRGNWWRTVMVYLVVLTMIIVLSVTAGLLGVLTQVFAARDLAVTTAVSAVMVVASGAVYMPFVTSMSLALYGDLQARKEGTDLERRIAGAPRSLSEQ